MALTFSRRTATTPAHRDPVLLAVVFAGGVLGTAIRSLLSDAFSRPSGSWPWITFVINVIGAFALGFLLEALVRAGRDDGIRRLARLGIGTGALGGFTTYSTFMVETTHLPWVLAAGYVVATVALGGLAAWAGIRAARTVTLRDGETP